MLYTPPPPSFFPYAPTPIVIHCYVIIIIIVIVIVIVIVIIIIIRCHHYHVVQLSQCINGCMILFFFCASG